MVSIDMRTGERIWTADIGSIETPWVWEIYICRHAGRAGCVFVERARPRALGEPAPAFEDPMIAKGVSIGRGRCWQAAKFMSLFDRRNAGA